METGSQHTETPVQNTGNRKSSRPKYELRDFNTKRDHFVQLCRPSLGSVYDIGHGVPQNYAKGVYWLRMAADQGDAIAENNLGIAYYYGLGVPQDSMTALHWLKKAAAQGVQKAEHMVQVIEHGK